MFKFKEMRIQKRLTAGFIMVSVITAIAAVVGMIAMLVIASRYDYALENYGFAQGDIGKMIGAFADARSSTRAIIAYTDTDIIAKALTEHQEMKDNCEEYLQIMTKTLTSDSEKEAYNRAATAIDQYWKIDSQVIELGNTLDEEQSLQAQKLAAEQLDPLYEQGYEALNELMTSNVNQGNRLESSLALLRNILLFVILGVIVLSAMISLTLGARIAKGISIPLSNLAARLKTFSQGDLGTPFPDIDSKDEVADMIHEAKSMAYNLNLVINDAGSLLGKMAEGNYAIASQIEDKYMGDFVKLIDSMREMNHRMNTALGQINEASEQVYAGSSNLAEASQSLAEGATEQAGAVQELQATFTNITEGVHQTSEYMQQAAEMARKYAQEADRSRAEMQEMMDAMERINETSRKIENIITEIDDIATQTNLLSLNASIEAARAGEAGRGFAVVAGQIRTLADQSKQSANDTRELIEGSIQEIAEGNNAAERAALSIQNVVKGMQEIAESSQRLTVISEEQASAMGQAESGVNQIAEVVQANSATAEESSATSEELSAQAESMRELVSRFKLKSV